MTKSKGFSGAELSIATQAFMLGELERKRLTRQDWEKQPEMANGVRRLNGEIDALQQVLGFMIQNRK
jgi:hypothetical protein